MGCKFKRETFLCDYLGSGNADVFNWDIVNLSTIFKEEFREDESEKEVVKGYANAVNCIANAIRMQNHPIKGVLEFRMDSLMIPFIFMVRHTVELILKYLRKRLKLQKSRKHNLVNLWKEVKDYLSKEKVDEGILEDFDVFIKVLDELDPDGSHSRYSKDNNGEIYHKKPKFIRVDMFNMVLQKLFLPLVDCG